MAPDDLAGVGMGLSARIRGDELELIGCCISVLVKPGADTEKDEKGRLTHEGQGGLLFSLSWAPCRQLGAAWVAPT